MELFRSVNVIRLARAGQPGVVARQTCTHGAARQHGDQHIHLGKGRRDTLHAHHRNVRFRQRGAHARVAFVGHQTHRAGFRHGKVTAGNTDFGTEEILTDLLTNEQGHGFRGFRAVIPQTFVQHAADLIAIFMNRRDHDVRRRILIQLQDIFPEIGFDHLDSGILQHMVDADLFGHHRLGLHHLLRIFTLRNLQNVASGIFFGFGEIDVPAVFRHFLGELIQVSVEVAQNVIADLAGTIAPVFPVA